MRHTHRSQPAMPRYKIIGKCELSVLLRIIPSTTDVRFTSDKENLPASEEPQKS